MSVVWPTADSFPQEPLREGYSEMCVDIALRTQMDLGPDKVRRRSTAGVRPWVCPLLLNGTQLTLLRSYYTSDTEGGSEQIEWVDPLDTGSTAYMRFTGPPSWVQVAHNLFRANVPLEILP